MSDRIRVLYVDDDISSLEIRGDILREEHGFDVVTAEDVETGKELLESMDIDCVLSDLEMPQEDGFDFLEYVRDRYPDLPFILFTAHESEQIAERAFEGGATDYFPKSIINISYELLAHRIRQAVTQYRLLRDSTTESGREESAARGGVIAGEKDAASATAVSSQPDDPTGGFQWVDGGEASPEAPSSHSPTADDAVAGRAEDNGGEAGDATDGPLAELVEAAAESGSGTGRSVTSPTTTTIEPTSTEEPDFERRAPSSNGIETTGSETEDDPVFRFVETALGSPREESIAGPGDPRTRTEADDGGETGLETSLTEDDLEPGIAESEAPQVSTEEDESPRESPEALPEASSMTDTESVQWDSAGEYSRPDGLDPGPGDSILLQCGAQDDREHAACVDLLSVTDVEDNHVLLIRYKQMPEERLERIATNAARVKVISIGYSQPVPESVREEVSTVKINNPSDLTRLGIVVTKSVNDWNRSDAEVAVCHHSLNVLLQYKNAKSVFRFLHIFLGKLRSVDAVSHFHVDPSAGNPQEINTLKPLFDSVVSVDSVGVHLES